MKNNTNERIGQNIRTIRKQKGFTQQYIANKVGVTKQTICKIEKYGSANQTTIARIANALFVDVKELYEPLEKKKVLLHEVNNFISIDERDATLHEQFVPIMKHINDIVAKRFTETIKEKCTLSADDFKQFLEKNGYHSNSYSPKEIYEICQKLNNEFILTVYSIYNGTAND